MGRQSFTGDKAGGVSNTLVNVRPSSERLSALDNNLEYDERGAKLACKSLG